MIIMYFDITVKFHDKKILKASSEYVNFSKIIDSFSKGLTVKTNI